MSLVYITFHDENIRDIERETVEEKHYKFPKYKSIHRQAVSDAPLNQIEQQGKKVISASKKYLHKTMGYADVPLEGPSKFLKKNGGVKWRRFNDHVCPPPRGLPPIPKRVEIPKKGENKVNFIKKNVKRVKSAVPPNYPDKFVDTVIGQTHNLNGTGLVPKHVLSKKFGKPPSYLKAIRKILESTICSKNLETKETSSGLTVLSDADRNTILMGLRANHLEVEKTYQLLPIFTDTNPKKQRKSKIEQELKRLEQDILLIESNPVILVCDD